MDNRDRMGILPGIAKDLTGMMVSRGSYHQLFFVRLVKNQRNIQSYHGDGDGWEFDESSFTGPIFASSRDILKWFTMCFFLMF